MRLIVVTSFAVITACGSPATTSKIHRPNDPNAVFATAVKEAYAAFEVAGVTEAERAALTTALAAATAALAIDPASELTPYAQSGRALYATSVAAGIAALASIPVQIFDILRGDVVTQAALRTAVEEAQKIDEATSSLRKPLDAALAYAASVPGDDPATVQTFAASVWDALAAWTGDRMTLALQRNGDMLARMLAADALSETAVRELLGGQQLAAATLPAYARDFIAAQTRRLDASRAFDSSVDGGLKRLMSGYTSDSNALVKESEQARAVRAYLAVIAPSPSPKETTSEKRPLPPTGFARFPFLISQKLAALSGAQAAQAADLAQSHGKGGLDDDFGVEPEAAMTVARARVATLTIATQTSLQARACYDEMSTFDPRAVGIGIGIDSPYVEAISAEAAAACVVRSELGACIARLTEILCDDLASCRDRLIAVTRAADAIATKDAQVGVVSMTAVHAERSECHELPVELVLGGFR